MSIEKSPELDPCGCCDAPVSLTPEEICNRPGLSAIRYRVGTYASFRQAMLQAIASKPELRNWTARTSDDYGIALLEMWAYLADILTFYQERFANEGFLRTALLRESVLRLAALLDYEPAPGVAATAHLAFTAQEGKQVKIPIGLRVQSVPGQDEKPQKFETVETITADARLSQVRIFPRPQSHNPFAPGSTGGRLLSGPDGLAPGDKVVVFSANRAEQKEIAALSQQDHQRILGWTPAIQNAGFNPFTARTYKVVRQMRLFGYNAPETYLRPEPTDPPSSEIIWTPVPGDPAPPPGPDYDLDARYEELKPGTQLLVVQSGAEVNDFARLVTVTNVTQHAASVGPLQDTVTQVSLVRSLASAPAASWAADQLHVFTRGAENTLLYKTWDGSDWTDWTSFSGVITSAPAAVSWDANYIAVFARGSDNSLCYTWLPGGDLWERWRSLGGELTSAPAAVHREGYRIDVFARGPHNALWHKWLDLTDSTWGGLESLGGVLTSAPAAVALGDGRIVVFARGPDNALYCKWEEGTDWSDWVRLGGVLTSAPAAVYSEGGRLDVFARGPDNALWHTLGNLMDLAWGGFESLGGVLTSAPAAVSRDGNRIDVFARGPDNSLWHKWWDGIRRSGWESRGGGLGMIDNLRQVVIYELDSPELTLWNRRYLRNLTGNSAYVPLRQPETPVPYPLPSQPKRTLILDDGRGKPNVVTVTAVKPVDTDANGWPDHLAVTFTPALTRSLNTGTAVLYGNVAKATHGETVADEALGSGDASAAFQSFALKKSPVTFVPDAQAKHCAANTLQVRVGGVLWHEKSTLYGRKSDERVYTTTVDDEGKTMVQFGDGVTGARLPTGRNNMVATYRQGLGREGNVKANSLTTLLDRIVGLKSVTNPGAAQGGADPETLEEARTNAPNTVRTFDRIVSLHDFEDVARESASVAKARASWEWDGEEQVVQLTVAGDGGAVVGDDVMKDLTDYLDARRDPNRKLVVGPHRQVFVKVEALIQVNPDYVGEKVQKAAENALLDYFAFENLNLGQPIHLSDIYRVLQEVEGVVAVDINRLQYKYEDDQTSHGATAEPVQGHLRILPAELAAIEQPVTDALVNVGMESP